MQPYRDQSAGSGSEKFTTPEENRKVMVESLRKAFSQVGTFDPTAVAKVRQRPQQPWMDRVPRQQRSWRPGQSLVPESLEVVKSAQASSGGVRKEDGAISTLMNGITAGMWRKGSYTQLNPDAIPDTPPAAPDVSTSALHLARQQGWKTSWQRASPKTPDTGTWTGYGAYKHTATIESA